MAGLSGSLAYDPSQLAGLNPGANTSGSTTTGSTLGPIKTMGTIGGTSSPFVPAPVTGTSMPAYSSPYAPSGATAALAGLGGTGSNVNQPGGPNTNVGSGEFGYTGSDLAKSFQSAGTMPGGLGTAAAAFMNSGAGYNPAVAQALIAAMQPQIAKGQAQLMGQFGAAGLGMGSPAALGMGDYLAQTNLDVGQLLSGLYEQSVNNYMEVLNMGHVDVRQEKQQGGGILGALGGLLPGIGQAMGDLSSTLGLSGGLGTALDVGAAIL